MADRDTECRLEGKEGAKQLCSACMLSLYKGKTPSDNVVIQ